MKTYNISFRYSKDGKTWYRLSKSFKATSDAGAIMQVQSSYPYVDEIKILSVR